MNILVSVERFGNISPRRVEARLSDDRVRMGDEGSCDASGSGASSEGCNARTEHAPLEGATSDCTRGGSADASSLAEKGLPDAVPRV